MKKIVILFISLIIITGCSKNINTPTSKVEEFLSRYQNLDPTIIENLKSSVDKEKMSKKQKKNYESIMEHQYQNLSYKINDEDIVDQTATVKVEIEVLNYSYSIMNSKKYYESHKDEIENYNDYKLKQLEQVKDKIKYDITFNLTQYDGVWELDEIDNYDLQKIHGLY